MVIENPHVTRSVAKANKAKEMMEVEKEQAVGLKIRIILKAGQGPYFARSPSSLVAAGTGPVSPAAAAGPAIVPAPVFGPLVAPAPRKRSSNGRIRKAAPIKTVEDILTQQASTAQWIKEGEEKARELEAASILASFANNILEFGGYKKRAREESVESVQTVEGACKRRR